MSRPPVVDVRNLSVWFQGRGGLFQRGAPPVRAVDGVSFALAGGETLALVGESGSGKTTVGRAIMGLLREAAGEIRFEDADMIGAGRRERRALRTRMQMIFQDPFDAMNPRETVGKIVAEPLAIHKKAMTADAKRERVGQALIDVGLTPPEDFFDRFPHELSGGQRQRVLIAGALVLEPAVVISDEPVSMLDASLKVEILHLLVKLQERHAFAQLMITHDLALTRYIADRIAILYLGRIMEAGPTRAVLRHPKHPYTRALSQVVPTLDRVGREKRILAGEIPHPSAIPGGCRFHPRCPEAVDRCRQAAPEDRRLGDRTVHCHLAT